jgi:hypothetical protein
MNKFTYSECFQIDPEGKNVITVYYPENIDFERLENVRDTIVQIQEDLDRWAKEPDNPIYVLCLPSDVRIKITKITVDPFVRTAAPRSLWSNLWSRYRW